MAGFSDSNTTRSPAALPWSHLRLFAFASVTLGMFLIGLCLLPTAVRGYVARAVLGLRMRASGSGAPTAPSRELQCQIRDEILSSEQLGAVLGQIGPPPQAGRVSSEAFPSAAEIEFVRQRLSIAPEKTDAAGEAPLVLTYTGLDSTWSVSLLDRLATHLIATLDERAAKRAEQTSAPHPQANLTAAIQKEHAAHQALDNFLSGHFDRLNRAGKPTEGLASTEKNASEPAIPKPRINPKWQSLREELDAQMAQREKILLDRTPEHPQAKEAAVKIESLKRQLEQTPKFLVDGEPTLSGSRKLEKTIRPAQFTSADSPAGAGREYEHLLAELRHAREERQTAERSAAQASTRPALPGAAVVRGRVVANAHLAQTLREAPSLSRLTLLALGAIFLGACVAALIRLPQTMPVYATLAQVEKDLSLPVVGVVSPASYSTAALSR